jgi:hypothetical protein
MQRLGSAFLLGRRFELANLKGFDLCDCAA